MRNKGFTLIELMIVVAIIAIIAVIAIPNLLESRKASNESSAIGAMRTIVTSNQQFRILKKAGTVPPTYGNFTSLVDHEMVDASFVQNYKSGYNFTIENAIANGSQFSVHASPASESDGFRMFYTDNSGRVTFSTNTALPDRSSPGVD